MLTLADRGIDLQDWGCFSRVIQVWQAENLTPPHIPYDRSRLKLLAKAIGADGWKGRPVVAVLVGHGLVKAITGSHRIAAAEIAGQSVPVVLVPGKARLACLRILKEDSWIFYDYRRMAARVRELGYDRLADLITAEERS